LERAGRVKGGAAAERSEDTLDAPEHSNRLTKGNGRSDFVRHGVPEEPFNADLATADITLSF
jgi:hypothetical protein